MKKNGFGLIMLVIMGALIGIGGIFGFKIGKPYMDAQTVKAQAEAVIREIQSNPANSEVELRQRLFNRLNVQGVLLKFENIQLKKQDGEVIGFEVDLPTEIKLWENAYLVLELNGDYPSRTQETSKK